MNDKQYKILTAIASIATIVATIVAILAWQLPQATPRSSNEEQEPLIVRSPSTSLLESPPSNTVEEYPKTFMERLENKIKKTITEPLQCSDGDLDTGINHERAFLFVSAMSKRDDPRIVIKKKNPKAYGIQTNTNFEKILYLNGPHSLNIISTDLIYHNELKFSAFENRNSDSHCSFDELRWVNKNCLMFRALSNGDDACITKSLGEIRPGLYFLILDDLNNFLGLKLRAIR